MLGKGGRRSNCWHPEGAQWVSLMLSISLPWVFLLLQSICMNEDECSLTESFLRLTVRQLWEKTVDISDLSLHFERNHLVLGTIAPCCD